MSEPEEDEDDEPRCRHRARWMAPITLPTLKWLGVELSFLNDDAEFAAALAERRREAKVRHRYAANARGLSRSRTVVR